MDMKQSLLTRSSKPVLSIGIFLMLSATAPAQDYDDRPASPYIEENNQIRRDKFDQVLPQAMRDNDIDMWIHVVREAIPDSFGAEELGSTSGVFVFTDRGGDRIERAILGRRWGASHRGWGEMDYKLVEESGAYDIIAEPIRVQEPLAGPDTEYDYRFEGLGEFVAERDPKRIGVNFKQDLGYWPTFRPHDDGLSHTDYVLLTKELGDKYADRVVSSEYVMVDYMRRKVASEVALLKQMRADEIEQIKKAFNAIEPGVTKARNGELGELTVFRRMKTGQSQRGRSAGWEDSVVQGGDILAAPSQGMYAYVLRQGETEPPAEIQKLWAEYLKVDKILAENIKAGLTPRQVV